MKITRTTPGAAPVVLYDGLDPSVHVVAAPARQAAARAEVAAAERAFRRPARRPARSEMTEEPADG